MPVLILTISEYLNELFQYCGLASITALRKLRGVVVMAIDLAIVLIIAILGAEYSWTHRARKVLNVIFPVEGGYVRASERTSASETE